MSVDIAIAIGMEVQQVDACPMGCGGGRQRRRGGRGGEEKAGMLVGVPPSLDT